MILSSNKIEKIYDNSFINQINLFQLDLSDNLLTSLGKDSFNGLFSLKKMNLSNNYIEIIHHELFKDLKNLIELDLSQNAISFIEDDSFLNQGFVKYLNLDYQFVFPLENKFKLTNKTLSGLESIKKIHIDRSTIIGLNLTLDNIISSLRPKIFQESFYGDTLRFYYETIQIIYSIENRWDKLDCKQLKLD